MKAQDNQTASYCTKVKKACLGLLKQPDIQLKIFLIAWLFALPVVFVSVDKNKETQNSKKSKYNTVQQSDLGMQSVLKDTVLFYNLFNQQKQK